MKRRISVMVNGDPYHEEVPVHQTLLEFLRDTVGLSGTKQGCGNGECGACTVIIDSQPKRSCLILAAEADGAQILTVEGLAEGGKLHPLQEAFVEKNAVQCGFCTPGMLMASKALLDRNPNPRPEDVKEALGGHLCRCTGYEAIYEAVKSAGEKLRVRAATSDQD